MKTKTCFTLMMDGTLAPVKISKILESTGMMAFIWKETLKNGHSFYRVNEYYTGMSLGISCRKLCEAEEKFLTTARNEAYWQDEEARTIHNQDLVKKAIEKYGYANQD